MKGTITLIIISLAISVGLNAQETRKIGSFDQIDVSESITVYLTEGNSDEARIEASDGKTDRVLIDNNGGRLKIHMKSGSWRNYNAKVFLEFQKLTAVEVSSSADLISKSKIRGNNLEIEVSSSGSAELDIEVSDLDVDVSSSGRAVLSGKTNYQRIDVNSSGRFLGFDLQSEKAKVNASSSGRAEINVSKEIDAEANSSGRVTYRGNPDKVYVDSNSSGRVSKD